MPTPRRSYCFSDSLAYRTASGDVTTSRPRAEASIWGSARSRRRWPCSSRFSASNKGRLNSTADALAAADCTQCVAASRTPATG